MFHKYNASTLRQMAAGILALALGTILVAGPTTAPSGAPSPDFHGVRADDATLQPVLVTGEEGKAQPLQDAPLSATVVDHKTIQDAGITQVDQAARYVPNLTMQEFTAQRLSFPFIRGIGSGRNNPAVTTYIDGVPQLSFATSNQQLVNIDRMEFLRGPQGTLYGRNTLGGVINILSRRPTNSVETDAQVTFGNFGLQDYRGSISGPIVKDKAYFGFSGGYTTRDGYSKNEFTNNNLDDREDYFGRVQFRLTPSPEWEIIFSLNGERNRDGDYALSDLNTLRDHPRRVSHDFEGTQERDIVEPSMVINYYGRNVEFTSISSYQYWRSRDRTDLDETQADLIRRDNKEDQRAFIQEMRLSSPAERPIVLNKDMKLSWLVGTFFFSSMYDQEAANDFRPAAAPNIVPFPFTQFDNANLNDVGIALFGQTTLTLWNKLDLTIGLRYDYQYSEGEIGHVASSPFIPASGFDDNRSFYKFAPRFSAAYRFTPELMAYASAAKGFKAGGFNPTPPATGHTSFADETSWTYEVGAKTSWFKNRLTLNGDLFYINWDNVQLDSPTGAPGVFFIDNAGSATSRGLEIELSARPIDNLELFAGFGYMETRFDKLTLPSGANASGNQLPFAPHTTWNAGAQYTIPISNSMKLFTRAEVFGVGRYFYDVSNAEAQGSYILTNFRAGVGTDRWRLEAFLDNAFNTKYVPLAFPFQLAPSGYVGESGAPATFGVTFAVHF